MGPRKVLVCKRAWRPSCAFQLLASLPSAPSRPPISWLPNSTSPWRPTRELSIDARRTHTTHTTHIRSTLHYLHSIVQPGWMSNSGMTLIKRPPESLIWNSWTNKDGSRLSAESETQSRETKARKYSWQPNLAKLLNRNCLPHLCCC